jgi:hypothetical protein
MNTIDKKLFKKVCMKRRNDKSLRIAFEFPLYDVNETNGPKTTFAGHNM